MWATDEINGYLQVAPPHDDAIQTVVSTHCQSAVTWYAQGFKTLQQEECPTFCFARGIDGASAVVAGRKRPEERGKGGQEAAARCWEL
jgi:hypothetical protein